MKAAIASADHTVAVGLLGLFTNTRPAPLEASAMASRSIFICGLSGMARTGRPSNSASSMHSS